jgi:hypothetical protein
MNKKADVDREEENSFQKKILKALSQPQTRILVPPVPPVQIDENEIDED